MPRSVERRDSMGKYCHASVRGWVARFSRTSNASGTIRKLAVPTARVMVRKVFHEVFSVFCILVLPLSYGKSLLFTKEMPGTHDEKGSIGKAFHDHIVA